MAPARRTPRAIFSTPWFLRSRLAMSPSPLVRRLVRRDLTGQPELDDVTVTHLAALRDLQLDGREQRGVVEPRHEVRNDQIRQRHAFDAERVAVVLARRGEPQVVGQALGEL